jgi:hypothetical protein
LPLHVSVFNYDHIQGAHELPEDGRKYGPKDVGASFKNVLNILGINVN